MNSTDWQSTAHGKAAAVEWAIKSGMPVEDCARTLEVDVDVLTSWMRDKDYKPEPDRIAIDNPKTDGVEDYANYFEKMYANVPDPDIAPGAFPRKPADSLSGIMSSEADALSDSEKRELSAILREGKELSKEQRNALAAMLLGSPEDARLEIIRGIMDLVLPEGHELRAVWTVKELTLRLQPGQSVRHIEIMHGIPGFPMLGRTILQILDGDRITKAYVFCRAKSLEPPESGSGKVKVRCLEPSFDFQKPHVTLTLAMLASFVRQENISGKEWAGLFGISEQLVSYHRKSLLHRIDERLGGKTRSRMTGTRTKDQSNKGGPQTSSGNRKKPTDSAA